MTTTTSTSGFAAVALWGTNTTSSVAPNLTNASNASTNMVGGKVQFENDNYRITMGDDNTVHVFNKHTGEDYLAWGDPHMNIDGKHSFDFWGTTTLALDDGTKVTIETTPWAQNPEMTLSSKVTITNGGYGVQVTGVDSNQTGDLGYQEVGPFGGLLDAVVTDGNVLHENPFGAGFLGIDNRGNLRAVDQQYINQTDWAKGGALQAQFAEAFAQLTGLLAVTFIGGFLASVALGSENLAPPVFTPRAPQPDDGGFLIVMARSNQNLSWFVAIGGSN